jgi:acetyl-CoA C-acetyltransferase
MTDLPTSEVTDTLATAADALYDVPAGFTFPGFYASIATAYMHKYGATPEAFMHVGLKNHEHGALNPKAQFGQRIADMMEAQKKRAEKRGKPVPTWSNEMEFLHDDRANLVVAWPMRLYDCSPVSDGAASLLLVSEDIAKNFTDKALHIIGSGQASDVTLRNRPDLTTLNSARRAANDAFEMAAQSTGKKITRDDIKVAEVHDCFTIAEIVATEDLGFFEPGKGHEAAMEGLTSRQGPRPINTSGGLKSKGHPVGASGAGQVVEVWKQLRGEAGERQLEGDISLGLTHNVGGTGESAFVHIFERR